MKIICIGRNYKQHVFELENKIPEERVKALKDIVQSYYPNKELNEDLLIEASNMNSFVFNENFVPHGKKVVDFFVKEHGACLLLEKCGENISWRQ